MPVIIMDRPFFQHQKFLELVRGNLQLPEVSLLDGWESSCDGISSTKER